MNVTLVMVMADGKSRELALAKLPASLGRGEECKIRIPLASVSRKHCEILMDEDDELIVRDLQSSNGTYVNTERVRSRELVPGDLISVGGVVFVVRIDGHPRQIDPAEAFSSGVVGAAGPAGNAGVPTWGDAGGGAAGAATGAGPGAKGPGPSTGGAGPAAGAGGKGAGAGVKAPASKPKNEDDDIDSILKDFDFSDLDDDDEPKKK